MENVKSKGYAGKDDSGKLSYWEFERRPVGDDDVLIEIKFAGICHSDLHTIMGDWGAQQYPQVPGHEIAGIVKQVGLNVTSFKVGDKAGVGCMVNSCGTCDNCKDSEEQFCEKGPVWTYGNPEEREPTGITQGGYSNNIVVDKHFVIKIPESLDLQHAAPLLCAGITTYSPLLKANVKPGDKVGVAGIGGLGHMAIKLAVAKGAQVYAFTTSPKKVEDALSFGAKEAIIVDSLDKLAPYKGKLDYMISTIPAQFDVAAYANVVKPYGSCTQVGMRPGMSLNISAIGLSINRVNFNASLIGGISATRDVVKFCAENKVYPTIEIIDPKDINDAWQRELKKDVRYRFVIDMSKL